MPTVEETVTINRSAEDIWSFLTTTDNVPVYESQVTRIEQLNGGEVALGTRWEGETKVLGRSLDWTTECVQFDPVSSFAFKTVEAKLPFEVRWTLAPADAGTDVTYRIDAASGLGGVFGRVGEPIVIKAQTRTVKTNLANLKELLEAEA